MKPQPGTGEWYARPCYGCGHAYQWHVQPAGRRHCEYRTDKRPGWVCDCPAFSEIVPTQG